MGIKNGISLFSKCGREIHISSLLNERVAIDMMTYIIKLYKLYKKDNSCKLWLKKVLEWVDNIQKYVKCVIVFDGPNKPIEKHPEILKRRINNIKYTKNINQDELINDLKLFDNGKIDILVNKYNIDSANIYSYLSSKIYGVNNSYPSMDEMNILYILLSEYSKYNNVQFVIASGEGESHCVYLLKEDKVDYVISEDSDLLMYNCSKFIMKFDGNKGILYNIDEIKNKIDCNFDELFCIGNILGNDYTSGIKNVGLIRGIDIIKKNGLENITSQFESPTYPRLIELFTPDKNIIEFKYTNEEYKIAITYLK